MQIVAYIKKKLYLCIVLQKYIIGIVMMERNNTDYNSMSDERLALMLGEFIKHHRVEKNISQNELGKRAGLSRSTVYLMEQGKFMTLNSIIKVLRVLDLLYVFDALKISQAPSPLELLRMQEKKRKNAYKKKAKHSL